MKRVATAVLLVLLSASVWAQFEHPDLKSGKAVVKNVVIMPPNVKIVKNGVKSVEELIDESRAVENALPPLIAAALQERHCEVNDKAFAGDAMEKDPDLRYAVADLQKKFDEVLPQIQKKPKDVRKGRFTMGDEVAKLNPGGTADALVFVRGYGQVVTGGKAFLGAMTRTYVGSGAIFYITVVDARNGTVLYYGLANNGTSSPAKNPEGSKKSLQKLFKNFPDGGAKS